MLRYTYIVCIVFFFGIVEKLNDTYKCTLWVDFEMLNLVVCDVTTGPQRVNFHQATERNSEITAY